jgi:hypothetical protein
MGFRMLITAPPASSFITAAGGVQTVAAALGALRSTAEYAPDTVNFQLDPVIAQVSHHLTSGTVIVPKFVLLADDLKASAPGALLHTNCSDIAKTIPDQLGCLLMARNDASVAISGGGDLTAKALKQAAFGDLDKMFQVFFGQLMGVSVNLGSTTSSPQAAGPAGGGPAGGPGAGGGGNGNGSPNAPGNGNQSSTPVPLLSQIIQGHRFKAQFAKDSNSRILVLEPTEAGGGSRIKHIFLVELFYTTPTPSFTGGSIVSYLLINPATSVVEKAEVLRFTVDYGKFHGKKIQTGSNFK